MTTKGFFFIPLRVFFFPTLVSTPLSVHTVTSDPAHAAGWSAPEPSAAASPTSSTPGASQSCPLSPTYHHPPRLSARRAAAGGHGRSARRHRGHIGPP